MTFSPADLTLLRSLRLIVFDFDGVFTDNRVLVFEDGREAVFCSRGDGLGLAGLRRVGVDLLILSTETNPVVGARARKLQIECVQGCEDKWTTLCEILAVRGLDPGEVAYMGNDVNDLDCLRHVGLPICVADAHPDARAAARLITERRGGEGAVREVCDAIIRARSGG